MLPAGPRYDDGLASPGHTLPAPNARDPRTALFVQGLLAASAATAAPNPQEVQALAVSAFAGRLLARRAGPVA